MAVRIGSEPLRRLGACANDQPGVHAQVASTVAVACLIVDEERGRWRYVQGIECRTVDLGLGFLRLHLERQDDRVELGLDPQLLKLDPRSVRAVADDGGLGAALSQFPNGRDGVLVQMDPLCRAPEVLLEPDDVGHRLVVVDVELREDRGEVGRRVRIGADAAGRASDGEGLKERRVIHSEPFRQQVPKRGPLRPHQRVVQIEEHGVPGHVVTSVTASFSPQAGQEGVDARRSIQCLRLGKLDDGRPGHVEVSQDLVGEEPRHL